MPFFFSLNGQGTSIRKNRLHQMARQGQVLDSILIPDNDS